MINSVEFVGHITSFDGESYPTIEACKNLKISFAFEPRKLEDLDAMLMDAMGVELNIFPEGMKFHCYAEFDECFKVTKIVDASGKQALSSFLHHPSFNLLSKDSTLIEKIKVKPCGLFQKNLHP